MSRATTERDQFIERVQRNHERALERVRKERDTFKLAVVAVADERDELKRQIAQLQWAVSLL